MLDNWDDVRFFLAAGRAGSLNAAARALRTSQPTVSRRITALERAVETKLFDRRAEGLVLTEIGEALWQRAVALEEAVHALESRVAARAPVMSGPVRISATEGLGALWLTPKLASLSRRHPALVVQIMLDNRAADLLRREADIALRLTRPLVPDLIARKVGELEFQLFAGADYLAAHGEPRSIGDLRHHRLVTLSLRESMLDESWQDVLDGGAAIAYSTNSSLAQIRGVAAGYGIGLLPRYAADHMPGLIPVLAGQDWRRRDIWLVGHPDVKDNVRVRTVFDEIVRLFSTDGRELTGRASGA